MSKSLGNFVTTRAVGEKSGYEPMRFHDDAGTLSQPDQLYAGDCRAVQSALERLYNCKELLQRAKNTAPEGDVTEDEEASLLRYKDQFIASMDDDLNTADAISAIFELVREVNSHVSAAAPAKKGYVEFSEKLFLELTGVLGLLYQEREEKIPQEVLDLVERRAKARKDKDFAAADALRDEIAALGYEVKETRQGVQITKKEA